jgi:hypothetical protein
MFVSKVVVVMVVWTYQRELRRKEGKGRERGYL